MAQIQAKEDLQALHRAWLTSPVQKGKEQRKRKAIQELQKQAGLKW
jgi:hypothetical protein